MNSLPVFRQKKDATIRDAFLYLSQLSLLQFLDADVAEFHRRAMTQETDMSLLIEKTRMLLVICRAILRGLTDVTLQDNLSVNSHFNVITIGNDLLSVPLSRRLERAVVIRFGRDNAID